MLQLAVPNYRQQRAIEAIDRASAELSTTIQTYAPNTATVHEVLDRLTALTEAVKALVITNES
jgi:hypothetical protein